MTLLNIPWKVLIIVGGIIGVVLVSYFTLQYVQTAERGKVLLEIQEGTNIKRKAIRDVLKNNTPADRNDATDSLQYLSDR